VGCGTNGSGKDCPSATTAELLVDMEGCSRDEVEGFMERVSAGDYYSRPSEGEESEEDE
jgi:hypothetical protein